MSLAVLARKSRSTNPRYNNSSGCFRLNMTNRGKLRTCINGYNKDCGLCNVTNRKNTDKRRYESSKQSSYHNFQRRITRYCKNKNSLNGSRTNNTTHVWADINESCIPKELYRNSSDIILKRKNEALNNFSNPNSDCYKEYEHKENNKGECIYYKTILCDPCCYHGNRIKNRVYTKKVGFKMEDNKELKSLTDLENLKNQQSDYISKLNAKTIKAFKYNFCLDMKNTNNEKYKKIYNKNYKLTCEEKILKSGNCN